MPKPRHTSCLKSVAHRSPDMLAGGITGYFGSTRALHGSRDPHLGRPGAIDGAWDLHSGFTAAIHGAWDLHCGSRSMEYGRRCLCCALQDLPLPPFCPPSLHPALFHFRLHPETSSVWTAAQAEVTISLWASGHLVLAFVLCGPSAGEFPELPCCKHIVCVRPRARARFACGSRSRSIETV